MGFDVLAHPLAFFLTTCVAIYTTQKAIKSLNRRNLPPGPKGIPFFGSLFQLSMKPWASEFEVWKKQHGPLTYLKITGQGYLILNTQEVAADLLDRRGHIYDDRPRFIMASEITCGGLFMPLMKSGETFRRMRRAAHEALNKAKLTEFQPIQTKEAVILTHGLLTTPNDWKGQISRAAASAILSLVYDVTNTTSINDPLVKKMDDFTSFITKALNPLTHFVEFFPWMKHIPSSMAKWKRNGEVHFRSYSDLIRGLFEGVENQINEGDERPSFAGTLIRERQRHRMGDFEASWLAGTIYGAGFETSTNVMMWFMLAMIVYPEKQKKCQEELDAVIGRSRMPTFKDQDNLPYLRATLRETLRWRPVVTMAPHYSKEGNDADEFNPDRFIDENGQLRPPLANTRDEGHATYGYGGRNCVGRHMANNALFISIASILWATHISAIQDEDGKPIVPDTLETVGEAAAVRPLPFDCLITPRFQEAAAIVSQTRELL